MPSCLPILIEAVFQSDKRPCRVLHAETKKLAYVLSERRVLLEANVQAACKLDDLHGHARGPVRLWHSQALSSGTSEGLAGNIQWRDELGKFSRRGHRRILRRPCFDAIAH